MADSFIKAEGIKKVYKRNISVLDNINIDIKKNTLYSIMGESGSGKSTLLSILGLLDKPSDGDLYIDGVNSINIKPKEINFLRMKKIGFIFQSFYLNNSLTAYENIILPMYINPQYTYSDMKIKSHELLELVGLKNRLNHYPTELSGGEKQRVSIARALANNPECILADEPTGNLDRENEKQVFELFQHLSSLGKSVVVVSHNVDIKKYSNVCFNLENGNLKENI
ncbi:putative ABC transport system ATP-binding protein/lipoprotein-releasing system ATP-binding protein [Pelagirhabdus alkalitolerans]|uniref:Putative ABC transport system ATP-binding protein/lipoprotein-releasing system ATP-binding protein n=1 Tax=Pelagirhabdus alkalitolerans TaxID=1612202 RepID=A0A1G6N0M3_9BACI|nr:ABC transporter ATP-binding protein [Pelagirhabdus alkalitolerans]SDC61370.1 putative ABC transport system ATP-binding protein/lipoprotein-releasing system ATP-binding protein [Pelagirhabdus alkalitolerans]